MMLKEMHRMLKNGKENKYTVIINYYSNAKDFISGFEYIEFVGEKISGALQFLESLKTFSTIFNEVSNRIIELIDVNKEACNMLIEETDKIKKYIEKITEEKRKLEPIITKHIEYSNNINEYNILRRKEIKEEKPNIYENEIQCIIEKEIETKNPGHKSRMIEGEEQMKRYNEIIYELRNHNNYLERFVEYTEVIKNGLKEYNENNIVKSIA